MKRLLLIIVSMASLVSHAQYTWSPLVSNVTSSITDIYFTLPGNAFGIFGTNDGQIGRTEDGFNWTIVHTLSQINGDQNSNWITGVYLEGTSPNFECVVATKGGQIYKSYDGGATWDLKYNSNPSLSCNDLDYGNGRLITGGMGKIYFSDDVGETWDSLTVAGTGEITKVSLSNTSGAFISQNQIYTTSNSGANWTQMTGLPHLYDIHDVEVLNTATLFTVGAFGEIFGTDDLGTSWSSVTSGTSEHLYNIEFGNATNGIIVGNNGTVLMTDTGGFDPWDSSPHGASMTAPIYALHTHNATNAWFGNDNGELYKAPEVTLAIDIQDVIKPDTVCQGETYTYTIQYEVTSGTAVNPVFQVLLNFVNISSGFIEHTGTFGLGVHYFDVVHTMNQSAEGTYGYVVTASPDAANTSTNLDGYGVIETEEIFVKFPEATTTVSPIYFCPGDLLELSASGGNNYNWYAGTTNSNPLVDLNLFPTSEGNYIVEIEQDYCTVYDTVFTFFSGDCFVDTVDTDTLQPKLQSYAFSPNGDGVNDTFVIDFISGTSNQVTFFNRYGDMIESFSNYDNENVVWDGTFLGVPVPPGTYYFIVEYEPSERHSGWVQIVK